MLRFAFCIFFTLITICSFSQDTHYWYSTYCAGGFFMPGAVIADNRDSSVLFYNPALLAHSSKSTISFSGTLYQVDRINIINGAGTGGNLFAQNFSVIPQVISGSFKIPGKKPFQVAYALLHDPGISFDPTQRSSSNKNVLNDSYSPGLEEYTGQVIYQNYLSEFTASLSAGYALTPSFKIGGTMEGTQRKQTYGLNFTSRVLPNTPGDTSIVTTDVTYFSTYQFYSMRWKVGIAWNWSNHHFGLVLRSPDVAVYSSGTLMSDNTYINLQSVPGIDPVNFIASTRQENLKVKWKNPPSIALGYSITFHKGLVYFSAEYFPGVKEYEMMTPANDFYAHTDTVITPLDPGLLRLKDARKAILNFGVGISAEVNKKLTAYLSFRTDFSFAGKELFADKYGYAPYTSYWDNYHFETGVNIKRAKYSLRPGLYFIYGSTHRYEQIVNFDNPQESNYLMGDVTTTTANHLASGFILSFIHNL